MMMNEGIAPLFKAYDVRGVVPDELDPDIAYRIGRALVTFLNVDSVCVGRDMRLSSPALAGGLIDGIRDQGADVVDIGLISTDGLYFAVGKFGFPAGVMITASHNPGEYNGFKLCRAEARPISIDDGIAEIRDLVIQNVFVDAEERGGLIERDVTDDFIDHALSMIDVSVVKPFSIAVDAGNGMAGKILPEVFKRLPCKLIPLYFELDGSFPNHPANPLEPENIRDLQAAVLEHGADLGVAFDGDADRMFLIDEHGAFVGGDMVTLMVATVLLRRQAGQPIVYNIICSRSVPEAILAAGGKPIRARVGHSFIKALMREHDAVFGGEHSGHFYFRDNWYADSGLIAFLTVLELLSIENTSIHRFLQPLDQRKRSGEINFEVRDPGATIERVRGHFADATVDLLDGLTVNYPDWWFNLRASNTQPLLRLNVEVDDPETLESRVRQLALLIEA
jgi:phosphomannomutase